MHISHFFSIKPYWELWNLKVPQKLLASSFSNFKHEKTLLNMVLQSLQAVKKNWNQDFIQRKPRLFQKAPALRPPTVHVQISPDRQVRRPKCTVSSTSAVTLILLTWKHSVPHPALPLHFCVLLLKQGRLCSDSPDILAKAISVCQFYSLDRPLNSLSWNASSAKCYPKSTTFFQAFTVINSYQ